MHGTQMAKTLFLLAGLWIGMLGSSVEGRASLDEKETDQLTDMTCDSGDTPIITEDYFRHQPNPSPCDNKCQPTTASSANARECYYDYELKCRMRVSLDDLNRIYRALDSGDRRQLNEISTDIANDGTKGSYKVKYVCVAGPVVDPCLSEDQQDNNNNNNKKPVTNLLVTPASHQSGDRDRAGPPCRKLCRLTPRDEEPPKVVVNFLLNDARRDDDNYLQYRYVFNAGRATPWRNVTSSYHYGDDAVFCFLHIKEIQVRLHLEDLSLVTRLWISVLGSEFTVTCEEEGPTVYIDDPVSASLTTQPELSTQDTVDTELGRCDPVLPYALGLGISAVIAVTLGVGLCIVCIRKRRSSEKVSSQQETQLSTSRAPDYVNTAHLDDATNDYDDVA